ncbi:unnamed protein product, partial [Allacma fusca]
MENSIFSEHAPEVNRDCLRYLKKRDNQCMNSNIYSQWSNLFQKYNMEGEFAILDKEYLVKHKRALVNKIERELINEDVAMMLRSENPSYTTLKTHAFMEAFYEEKRSWSFTKFIQNF